jgi:O-acetyl-ADP-ribose deacetylase (regulator of RNase III)
VAYFATDGAALTTERTPAVAAVREMQCGHTRITLVEGEPIHFPRETIYTTVNARGVMASGFAGAIRLAAGAEVERELRAQGPLLVGEAYQVSPGRLAERGVCRIICGITTPEPGAAPKEVAVREALTSALRLATQARTRGMTFPEVGTRIPGIDLRDAAEILVDILTGEVRRGSPLEAVTIASLHLDYLRACRAHLEARGATIAH